jgi:hypothetical protein
LQNITFPLSHELVESITDPNANGGGIVVSGTEGNGSEICDGEGREHVGFANGTVAVSPYWSRLYGSFIVPDATTSPTAVTASLVVSAPSAFLSGAAFKNTVTVKDQTGNLASYIGPVMPEPSDNQPKTAVAREANSSSPFDAYDIEDQIKTISSDLARNFSRVNGGNS